MKKLLLFTAFSLLLMPVSHSFGAMTDADKLTTTNGALLGFTPSSKVFMYYASDDASNNQTYVAMAKHEGGDRSYATTTKTNLLVSQESDDCPGQYAIECANTVGATVLDATNGVDNVDGLPGWSVL